MCHFYYYFISIHENKKLIIKTESIDTKYNLFVVIISIFLLLIIILNLLLFNIIKIKKFAKKINFLQPNFIYLLCFINNPIGFIFDINNI